MIFEASEAVGVPKLTISTSELSVSSDDNDVVPDVYLPRQHVVPAVSSFAKDVTNPLVSTIHSAVPTILPTSACSCGAASYKCNAAL